MEVVKNENLVDKRPTDTIYTVGTDNNVFLRTKTVLKVDRDPVVVLFDARHAPAPLDWDGGRQPVPRTTGLSANDWRLGRVLSQEKKFKSTTTTFRRQELDNIMRPDT